MDPRVSGHRLLRFQARRRRERGGGRGRDGRGSDHRLGDSARGADSQLASRSRLRGRCGPRRNGACVSMGTECSRLLHCARLPPAPERGAADATAAPSSPSSRRDLPSALRHLQQGNIAPVDFAQAAIGPGMAVYTRYARMLDAGQGDDGARGACAHQPDTRRGARRAGRRLRRRQPLGASVVRAVGLRRGRVRRGRDALQGEEHQRRRHGRGGHRRFEGRQGAPAQARASCPRTGTRLPTRA